MASLKVKELLCLLYSGLLFISGVLLIGFSVVLSYKVFYHFKFIPTSSIGPFIVYFLLGFIHLFLTWLGVKGPTREHDIHIILFMVITLALLIAECAVGVWSIILWDEVDVESLHLMTDSFNELLNNDFNKKHWFTLESEVILQRDRDALDNIGSVAERSKALVLGTSPKGLKMLWFQWTRRISKERFSAFFLL
ncbi:hypothetical protein MTP99_017219 [Tenebrio molitor]|nr:hypothetical protein MTP99_017219 [Tenebrio molitor]